MVIGDGLSILYFQSMDYQYLLGAFFLAAAIIGGFMPARCRFIAILKN